MSDFETDPRRRPADPDSQPDHSAQAPDESSHPRGLPGEAVEPMGREADSESATQPQPAMPPGPYASAGQPLPYAPTGQPEQYPPVGQSWHPGQPHQPGWPGNGGYGAGPPPGGYAAQPGPPDQHSGLAPQPPAGGYPPPPIWAQHIGAQHTGVQHPGPPTADRRRGRFGRVVAIGAAAAVLAVGSGLLGGFVATRADDEAPAPGVNSRPAAAAPVVERSSLAAIAEAVQPSVVSVTTGNGEGSGVVLTKDGYVLTNNHVVASATGNRVGVVFSNGKSAQAQIIGVDALTDLAVVKADGVSDLRPATFGDSSAMQVGDTVLALGSPLGLQGSVTAGIVSALDRTIRAGGEQRSPLEQPSQTRSMSGLMQTDAPINPGNSGGALVNTRGEVIGINTAIATSGQGQGNIGVGFAIPSNKAEQVAGQLRKGEKVSHPFLGVSVTNAETGGALVRTVQEGGPAAKAGLKTGDVVTKLGDKEINDSDDLVSLVQTAKVGDRLTVTYLRNGDQRTATATLGEAS